MKKHFIKRELDKNNKFGQKTIYYHSLDEIIRIGESLHGIKPDKKYLDFNEKYKYTPKMKYSPLQPEPSCEPSRTYPYHDVLFHTFAIKKDETMIITSPTSALKAGLMIKSEDEIKKILYSDDEEGFELIKKRVREAGDKNLFSEAFVEGLLCYNAGTYKVSSKSEETLDKIIMEFNDDKSDVIIKKETSPKLYDLAGKQPLRKIPLTQEFFIPESHDIFGNCYLNKMSKIKYEWLRIQIYCHHWLTVLYALKHGNERIGVKGADYASNIIIPFEDIISMKNPEIVRTALEMNYFKNTDFPNPSFARKEELLNCHVDAWLLNFPEEIHPPEINDVMKKYALSDYQRKEKTARIWGLYKIHPEIVKHWKKVINLMSLNDLKQEVQDLSKEELQEYFYNKARDKKFLKKTQTINSSKYYSVDADSVKTPLRIARKDDVLFYDGWPYKNRKLTTP